MTVPNDPASILYTSNGVSTVYAFPFPIPYQADGVTPAILVSAIQSVGGAVIQTTISPSMYTLAGIGDPSGGSVTLVTPLLNGVQLKIQRVLTALQPYDFPNQGFYPETMEAAVDYQAMLVQQIQGMIQRALLVPDGEGSEIIPTIANRLGKYLAFDSTGNPIAASPPANIPITSYMLGLLTTASMAAALAYLGAVAKAGDTMTGPLQVRDTGAHGYVDLATGDATHTGTVEFRKADNTRMGYVGSGAGDLLNLFADPTFNWVFSNFDPLGPLLKPLGYAHLPPVYFTASNWIRAENSGKLQIAEAGTALFLCTTLVTQPAVFDGMTVVVLNRTGSPMAINRESGVGLYWFNNSGAVVEGNRTLAALGKAVITFNDGIYDIAGTGLS